MSGLTLERLLFDRSDVAGSPQLGAHLLGDSSAVITSHAVSSDEGLDVYLLNTSIEVTASDLDIRSLNVATDGDHVYIMDSTGANALAIDASGYITANINGTVTVQATQLDIDDLDYTTDSVTAHQGGTWVSQISDGTDTLEINTDGSINVNLTDDGIADDEADSGNPFKVGSRSYFASSALTALSASGDRADLLSDAYRRIYINDAPNVGINNAAVSVGLTEVALPTTALAGRTRILIQNNGEKPLFVGKTGVSTSNGIEVAKGGTLSLEAGQGLALFGVSTAAAQDIRVLELA